MILPFSKFDIFKIQFNLVFVRAYLTLKSYQFNTNSTLIEK